MQEDSQKRTHLGLMRVIEFWATAAEGFVLEWTWLMKGTGTCSQQLRYEGSKYQCEKILLVFEILILQLLNFAAT